MGLVLGSVSTVRADLQDLSLHNRQMHERLRRSELPAAWTGWFPSLPMDVVGESR